MNIEDDERKYNNRLGWCYGDLGQLLLFHKLQKLDLLPEEYANLIDTLAKSTISRKNSLETLVEDSSFCHGAAGLAQFYVSFIE